MKTYKILYEESEPVLSVFETVMAEMAGDLGLSLQIEPRNFSTVSNPLGDVDGADIMRVTMERSLEWLKSCPVQPVNVSLYGAADTFVRTSKGLSPQLFFEKSLHQTIIREAHHVDIRESAYVIGNGPLLRVVAGVALGLGFRRVYVVGEDEEDLLEQKELLQRIFIGAEVLTLPTHSLTLQTVGASLLVNTFSLKDRPELSADLAYFNFMRRGGLVLDLYGFGGEQPVLDEALRAGLRVIPAHLVSAGRDLALLESLKIDTSSFGKKYCEAWLELMQKRVSGN